MYGSFETRKLKWDTFLLISSATYLYQLAYSATLDKILIFILIQFQLLRFKEFNYLDLIKIYLHVTHISFCK